MAASRTTSERRRLATRIGGIERLCGPDDPRLPELRRDRRAAELAEHVERLVNEAPPLTQAQRDRIAALLRPSASERGAA